MSFRRITKLRVNIAKCQTHITYDNHTIRVLDQNPFGFAFRHVEASSQISKLDVLEQAGIFMKRHFGKGGCVAKTPSFCRFLLEMGQELPLEEELKEEMQRLQEQSSETSEWQPPRQLADTRRGQLLLDDQLYGSFADEEETECDESAETEELEHTTDPSMPEKANQLSTDTETEGKDQGNRRLVAMEQPQRATIIEWPEEKIKIINCAWHLKNCSWRNDYNGEYHLPKCYCDKIRQTMEYIDELTKLLQVTDEEQLLSSSDLNANVMSLNGMLSHLNQLIQLQLHEQEQPEDDDDEGYMETEIYK